MIGDNTMSTERPMIFTTKGNVFVDTLVRKDGWEFTPSSVLYWEEYWQEEEMVRRSCAIFQMPENSKLGVVQGQIN